MNFKCRYCGKQIKDREKETDTELGRHIAEVASRDALMHTQGVTPYTVCLDCADIIKNDFERVEIK